MEPENEKKSTAPKNLQYYVSVKCDDGSSIQISKKYPSYEEALAFYQKILDALRSNSKLELIEVNEIEDPSSSIMTFQTINLIPVKFL